MRQAFFVKLILVILLDLASKFNLVAFQLFWDFTSHTRGPPFALGEMGSQRSICDTTVPDPKMSSVRDGSQNPSHGPGVCMVKVKPMIKDIVIYWNQF